MTRNEALREFIETIEETGGVVKTREGLYEPVGDREWIDLGHAYISACRSLQKEPMIVDDDESENDEEQAT